MQPNQRFRLFIIITIEHRIHYLYNIVKCFLQMYLVDFSAPKKYFTYTYIYILEKHCNHQSYSVFIMLQIIIFYYMVLYQNRGWMHRNFCCLIYRLWVLMPHQVYQFKQNPVSPLFIRVYEVFQIFIKMFVFAFFRCKNWLHIYYNIYYQKNQYLHIKDIYHLPSIRNSINRNNAHST